MAGFSIATWIGAILSFGVTPFITRIFEPDEVGKINLFFTFLTVFQYVGILGMDQAYIRFYNKPSGRNDKDGLFKLCTSLSMGFSLIICVGVIFFGDTISKEISSEASSSIILSLVICVFARIFLTLSNSYYRMQNNIFLYSLQVILLTLAGKVSYLGAAFWKPEHKNAIYIVTLSYAIIFVFFFIIQLYSKRYSKVYFGKNETIPLLNYAIPIMPVMIMAWINTSIPIFILKRFVDYSAIGIYSNAITIVSVITLLQSGFNIFWPPFVYENYKTNPQKIITIHKLITFSMVIFGLFVLISQDIIFLLVGEAYREGKDFFSFLLISPIFYTIAETTGLGINISKRSYLNLIVTGTSAVINIVMCYLLVPIYGAAGAAVAVATSAIVMLVVKTYIGEKYYKCIDNYSKSVSAPLIFVIVAICNYVYSNQPTMRYTSTLIGIVLLCILFKSELIYLLKQGKGILNNILKK